MQLDHTMNDRVGNDLHVNTREERKSSEIIDVSGALHYIRLRIKKRNFCALITAFTVRMIVQINHFGPIHLTCN